MNRFHLHLHVADLATSVGFYSKLFGAEPTRLEADCAKWMIEDPRLNFAISTRGHATGIDHLGLQTDDEDGLGLLKSRMLAAGMALENEGATSCCYARSEKHWVTDPQGIAWEQFHTLGNIPVFNEKTAPTAAGACCTPSAAGVAPSVAVPVAIPVVQAACCTPAQAKGGCW